VVEIALGVLAEQSAKRGAVSPCATWSRNSLPLLVAKVAQKPRTASLAGVQSAKPKTNAFGSQSI